MLLRSVRPDDAPMLGRYFLGAIARDGPGLRPASLLSADGQSALHRSLQRPYPAHARHRRWRACAQVIAKFIVHFGVYESDARRYQERGMALDASVDSELAPSVADAYQSNGVGSLVMGHLLPLLRRLERRRLALVGGVRGDNPRAIHFYEKFGFEKVGEFQSRDVVSFDMIAEL